MPNDSKTETRPIAPQRIDVNSLLRKTLKALGPVAHAQHVMFTTRPTRRKLFASLDEIQILSVLDHLVRDALKFSAKGGHVRLAVRRGDDEVRFTLIDASMSAVVRELHSSQAIVRAHGGRLWVDSVAGTGTAYHLTLPDMPTAS